MGTSGYRLVLLCLPHRRPTVPVSRVSHSLKAGTELHRWLQPVCALSNQVPLFLLVLRPSPGLVVFPVTGSTTCPARTCPLVTFRLWEGVRDPLACARSCKALPTAAGTP